jgi:DNA helicase-2/ATP-dependent DNA helicase PcrA
VLARQMTVKQLLLEELNEDQRKPVVDYYGSSLICAAPGSGKTKTIVSRAAYMIEEGIDPSNILMFTFTRKGATEIRERVEAKIGKKATGILVGTYHSFCSRTLRKYCMYLGWKTNFSTYDEEDKLKLLKSIVTNVNIKPQVVASHISNWKDRMISPTQAQASAVSEYEIYFAACYEQYQQKMKAQNAFDFDDLIYYTIRLFEQFPEVQAEVNDRYQFIMADEFQDSSERDIELIIHLGGPQMNVCLIMDDEQSIYGFRGANIESVFKLIENMDIKQYTLGQNYRSTKTIVAAARSVIVNNSMQLEKTVFTNNKQGEKVVYMECTDTNAEALQIVKLIMALTRKKPKPGEKRIKLGDIAVLYRMSYLSRVIEEYLLKNGIKYTIVGGCPFYARKEIKDIMSYLRFIYNPDDVQAFKRIINTPKRGIGEKTIEHLFHCQNDQKHVNIDNESMLMQACENATLKGTAKKGMEQFVATIEHLKDFILNNEATPSRAIREIVRTLKYNDYLIETEKKDAEEKIANVAELIEIAGQYDTLEDFICNMALNNVETEDTEDMEEDKVQLLTMHSCKGLEFPVVIISGANEGIIPHYKADTINSIDEERRLWYVAMTRAEELLFMLRSKMMPMNGVPNYCKESRFIQEIEPEYIAKI